MQTFILKENVLTANVLYVADKGKIFKGGFIALVKEFTFETSWTDKETVKRFRKEAQLKKYMGAKYPEFDLDI